MPYEDDEPKMRLGEDILFWICVPFLIAFIFIVMVPVLLHHVIFRYIIRTKGMTLWEWFEQDEMDMFSVYDYDNEDEKMFHGKPGDYEDKDK